MNDEHIWQYDKMATLSAQFHDVRHFIPTESEESSIIASDITRDDNIRLKIGFPFHLKSEKIMQSNADV